ncbi:hypothetical protein MMC13_004198 [Lambiella insularis]|nr:hypothetical protein [Lambiella insularis]
MSFSYVPDHAQENLGNLSTGGTQLFGQVTQARLYSEPGVCSPDHLLAKASAPYPACMWLTVVSGGAQFEPSFSADFLYGTDYLTQDPVGGIARPELTGIVAPDDGDTPFLMSVTGIQFGTPVLDAIVSTNTSTGLAVPYGASYSVWVPTFRGGSAKYANLQNSIFVASETVSDSPVPGEFYVGMKMSKVFCTNTSIVIGQEFP